jgi:hypothetical protein
MKITFVFLVPLVLFTGFYFLTTLSQKQISYTFSRPSITPIPTVVTPTSTPKPASRLIYMDNVPFAAQAPFGNWKDPKEQNGCEEAASTIAVYWARGKPLTKQQMLDEVLAISAYEQQEYGSSVDTSSTDTVERVIKGYFNYPNSQAHILQNADQIINWLSNGYLVITPMDGRLVGNPYYTAPGPERHMIVIRGFDPKTGEFITNDAGTRQGENYRYPKNKFFNAIRDYPTGDHQPILDPSSKSAILVSKTPIQ